MQLGVILNRVFRVKNNPLFQYITEHQDDIDKLYLILPLEDLSDAAEAKRNYYHKVVSHFVKSLEYHQIYPYIVTYTSLEAFLDELTLTHVLMGKDIMSYHKATYDFSHIKSDLEQHHIEVIGLRVNHYFQPSMTFNKQQQPYKVFTRFYQENRKQLIAHPNMDYQYKQLSQLVEKGFNMSDIELSSNLSMEEDVRTAWHNFLSEDISNYKQLIDDVTQDDVSGLGKYLAYGLLDIREIVTDLLAGYETDETNYEAFIREVLFREFYYVLMTQYPETAVQSFSKKYRSMNWSYNQTNFKAWQQGQTGYPIVDAAMHKLNQTGYMHNRLRMVVSQFLTKHLFIDWTWGEDYFRQYLIDYDNASNVHGWQWSASTGTDAVPYFRMFNPIRQSERFDAQGDFIKTQLEVLNDVPSKYIHNTTRYKDVLQEQYHIEIGKDYPQAIVDHKACRDYVMHQFKQY